MDKIIVENGKMFLQEAIDGMIESQVSLSEAYYQSLVAIREVEEFKERIRGRNE